jgi:uncharacterized phage protein (TIGR02218 family)
MKTLSAGLLALYAAPERTIATYWKVTRTDGQIFGFTDHDVPAVISGVTYEAFSGFTASQISTNALLSVDNMEVQGLFDSSGITDAELEAGVWDNAEIEVFEANYLDFTMGRNVLLTGWLGQVRRDDGLFVAELRSLTTKLQKTVGDMITPSCRYKLGDADCKVDLDALTENDVPVTSVASRRIFTGGIEDPSPIYPTGWFSWGVVTFTTGLNAGFSMDVKSYTTGGVVELQLPFPYEVAIGDQFSISPGCNKLLKTGPDEYLGDCKVKFDNVVNFGGEPEVPLPSKTFRLPGS